MNPFSKRPDLEQLAEEAIKELVASGEFFSYSGNLPRNTRRMLRSLKSRSDEDQFDDIFSERMIALTKNFYVEEVSDDDLNEKLLEPSYQRPIMVDLYSDYCRPCQHVLPIVYQLAGKYGEALTVVKVNVSRNPKFAALFLGLIQVTPAFLFFKDGQPVERAGHLRRLLGQRAEISTTRAGLEKRILSVLAEIVSR
jgi:thiol-disulfide isomerase/thioredoxin